MSKIAVYFPGIGYHCDKPLLYYSKNIACGLGYKNYRNMSYTYKAENIRGNQTLSRFARQLIDEEKMKEAYEVLFLQAESELSDSPSQIESLLTAAEQTYIKRQQAIERENQEQQ